MARPDKIMGRFRGVVAAAITGQFGDATAPDLALVMSDASGNLIVATEGIAEGVIWTPEGKASTEVANYNVAAAGSVMTVFTLAEFSDVESETLFAAGDTLWSSAAGDAVIAAPTIKQRVGVVYANEKGTERLVFNIALPET